MLLVRLMLDLLQNSQHYPCFNIDRMTLAKQGDNALGSISLSVCMFVNLGVLRAHYTPLQRYMGYLCTTKAQCAPWCTRETIFFEKFRGSSIRDVTVLGLSGKNTGHRLGRVHQHSGIFM